MKVTLIQPGSPACGVSGAFFFRNIPAHGLIQLESLTPPEWDVTTINENFDRIDFDEPTDVVGITAMTTLAPRAYEIAHEYRARGVPVIMGGIHASVLPDEAARHVDSVVIGEADEIWADILDDAAAGRLLSRYVAERPASLDFDFRRRPARTRVVRISRLIPFKMSFAYYQTGRGCPHGCRFCSVAQFNGRRLRKRSIGPLIDDIAEELRTHDVDYLVFMDDNIMADKGYARELFTALKPLGVRWMSQTDIRIADDDIIDLAADSGLAMVFIGLESTDPRTLENAASAIKRRWRDKYEDSIRKLHDRGIAIVGSMMIGADEDPPGVGRATAEWGRANRLDTAIFYIYTPLPGTLLFDEMESQGRILTRDWHEYGLARCVFDPLGEKTALDVEREAIEGHRAFYSLGSIMRRINRLSWKDLALSLFMNFDFRAHGNDR